MAQKMNSSQSKILFKSFRLIVSTRAGFSKVEGKDSFTRQELDMIANKLAVDDPDKHTWTPFFKPHHNTLTGNYDVNVLIAELEARRKTVVWHDHRSRTSSIEIGNLKKSLVCFMVNVPVRRFGGLWRSTHWIALPKIDGIWCNLDSDLLVSKSFENEELTAFMDMLLVKVEKYLLSYCFESVEVHVNLVLAYHYSWFFFFSQTWIS